ncbi:hypothetical protein [Streptomyces acidicola]|uniref:Uncharacterized protein n=1 Tax=Streptomyces acidicola TaxID=2596892 RepID=A0A5N8X818_9ACTN|nr:hypothetical protein [Streptomyces acidicola]MPY55208.1 hypothetical protein [Streptomyces acidicola]
MNKRNRTDRANGDPVHASTHGSSIAQCSALRGGAAVLVALTPPTAQAAPNLSGRVSRALLACDGHALTSTAWY